MWYTQGFFDKRGDALIIDSSAYIPTLNHTNGKYVALFHDKTNNVLREVTSKLYRRTHTDYKNIDMNLDSCCGYKSLTPPRSGKNASQGITVQGVFVPFLRKAPNPQ